MGVFSPSAAIAPSMDSKVADLNSSLTEDIVGESLLRGQPRYTAKVSQAAARPCTPRGAVIRSAMELASDVVGLWLVLLTALGDRYRVKVSDDGSVVGLWQRT